MLSIDEMLKFYPEPMHKYKRQILREYLQYKILEIIFNSKFSDHIVFIGGTAIRIVHGSQRFSEDIDLDSKDLVLSNFTELSEIVSAELELEGYRVETKVVSKYAFRCYIRFPGLLFDNNLSGYENEKILIQLDAEKQPYQYSGKEFLLNRFSILTRILVVPKDILLAQKISAFLNRKRTKARDIYDIIFMYSFTKPELNYLTITNGIESVASLKSVLLDKCKELDMKKLKKEIEVFLINPEEAKRIEMFPDFIKSIE